MFFRLFPKVLTSKCALSKTKDDKYKYFIHISDIINPSAANYILRMVFYAQSGRDASILLSTSNHPDYERDDVYEFGNNISTPLQNI